MYTEEERSILNMSNINGANIIKYVIAKDNHDIDMNYCYDIAKSCNERYDGNGYPHGLSGNSIPIATQIASLAIEYNNLINTNKNNKNLTITISVSGVIVVILTISLVVVCIKRKH